MHSFNVEYQSIHPASSFHKKKENTLIDAINASCKLLLEVVLAFVGSFSLKHKSLSFKVLTCYHVEIPNWVWSRHGIFKKRKNHFISGYTSKNNSSSTKIC